MAFTLKLKTYYKQFTSIFKFVYRMHIVAEYFLRQPFSYVYQDVNKNYYLREEFLVDFNNPDMQKLIGILIQPTKAGTIAKMFQWAFDMPYDLKRLEMDWNLRRASDTLELDYGVCADKAVMLVALLRGANIPARVVEGHLDGGAHAWVQVNYRGGWRNIDPTNGNFARTYEEYIIEEEPYKGEVGFKSTFDINLLKPEAQQIILNEWGYVILDETNNLNNSDIFYFTWKDEVWDIPFFPPLT